MLIIILIQEQLSLQNVETFYDISSYTVYLIKLIHFASRRKGQKAFDSYKLDDIG